MTTTTTRAVSAQQLNFQYSWNAIAPDNPRITGWPDSTLLNRHEGYEVLAFLNRTCSTLEQALKAERGIRLYLPGAVRSHANVLQWLQQNWAAFT